MVINFHKTSGFTHDPFFIFFMTFQRYKLDFSAQYLADAGAQKKGTTGNPSHSHLTCYPAHFRHKSDNKSSS